LKGDDVKIQQAALKLLCLPLVGLALPLTTFATPAVNDTAFYTGSVKMQGRNMAISSELQIMQFDAASNSYLQRTTNAIAGQVKTQEAWVNANNMLTAEIATGIIAQCTDLKGKIETVEVAAGIFTTCAVSTSDAEYTGTVWVAAVPFGTVKAINISRDGSYQSRMELESFQIGSGSH
jgi:hypothetical protein